MYNENENNNNYRPRFDVKTGERIHYADEEVYTTSSDTVEDTVEASTEETFTEGTSQHVNFEDKPKKSHNIFRFKPVRLVASALAFGVVAGAVMFGFYYSGVKLFPNNTTYQIATVASATATSAISSDTASATAGMNVEAVAQAALPAMVQLTGTTTVSSASSSYYGMFGGTQAYEATTSGTGIIVGKSDSELLILTNAHVVEDVNNLACVFIDNEQVAATVKGAKSDKDIAVVAINLSDIKSSTLDSIAIASLGNSDDIVLGQQVVAIGNALGEGQSVTTGIISALNRSITVDNVTFSGLFTTDAAINSGNSGGALLDAAGNVIAINFAKTSSTGVEGMAYSIPVSTVRDLIDSLMNKETRTKVDSSKASYLGITGVDITSSISSAYGYPQGVLVKSVESGSAAEKGGLGAYDVIVSFDDTTISSMTGLQSIMTYYAAGETVTIEYYHIEGSEYVLKTAQVTLGSK